MEPNNHIQRIFDALVKFNKRLDTIDAKINQYEGQVQQHNDTNPERSESINELTTALVKAQSQMGIAGKSSSGYNFKYADIEEVIKASRPALTENGLAILQMVHSINARESYLYTLLSHESGQWIQSRTLLLPDKEGNQGFGAAVTYIRRYAYVAIIGLSVANENDIDKPTK